MASWQESKGWRAQVMQETMAIVRRGEYLTPKGTRVILPTGRMKQGVFRTTLARDTHALDAPLTGEVDTEVVVVDGECLDEALALQQRGLNPVVLNMANPNHPGGGYLAGSAAQEESLFRRTNYFQHLVNPDPLPQEHLVRYPIPDFGGIYSPDVLVFRRGDRARCELVEVTAFCSFIAAAAYYNPPVEDGRLPADVAGRMRKKIAGVLKLGLHRGHDAIVLSAWGCGAFRNPAAHVAELFREVIGTHFRHSYKVIEFAIINDRNAHHPANPRGNFLPFKEAFAATAD